MKKDCKGTVLVADDHEDTREFLRVFLEVEGFKVIVAEDGAKAVSLALQEKPDLILTDLHMPELDGIAAIKQIRRAAELRDVPILAMSADGQRGMELFLEIDDLGTGFIHYLTKPLNLSEVLEEINRQLCMPA